MAKQFTDTMTSAEYLKYMAEKANKPGKYKNKWVKYDGQAFQSQAECDRYVKLKMLLEGGKLLSVQRQRLFKIVINNVQICTYRCDFFVKTLEGGFRVEDVKGFITEEYLIKKRLMKVVYNVDIYEPNRLTPATHRSRNAKYYAKKSK